MNHLTLDTNVDINVDPSPPTSSTSSSESPLAQSDTTLPSSFSPPSSQPDTLETASTKSLPTATVKFAPLPTIGPRNRKSNQPLGMAARAQLLKRRHEGRRELVISASPMWTNAELEEQRKRIEAMSARHAEFQARENAQEVSRQRDEVEHERRPLSEDGIEDPILVLGKIVKVAGKTLWSRMSRSKSEARLAPQRRRPRDLSPLPILIKSLPPVPGNAGQQSQPLHQNDVSETEGDARELEIVERVSDEEVLPPVTFSAPPD